MSAASATKRREATPWERERRPGAWRTPWLAVRLIFPLCVASCGRGTDASAPPSPALDPARAEVLDAALMDIEMRILPPVRARMSLGELPERIGDLRSSLATADRSELLALLDLSDASLRVLSVGSVPIEADLAVVDLTILVIREAV